MKKLLLAALALLTLAIPVQVAAQAAPSRAAQTVSFTMAGEPAKAQPTPSDPSTKNKFAMMIKLSSDLVSIFNGSQITAVNFYTGENSETGKNHIKEGRIFFLTGLFSKTPAYEQNFTIDTEEAMALQTIYLDEPYTPKTNYDLYVAVELTVTDATDCPYVTDGITNHGYVDGGYISQHTDNAFYWMQKTTTDGFVCVGIELSGENVPANMMSVSALDCKTFVNQNEEFPLNITLTNNGINKVSSIEYEYTIGKHEAVSGTLDLPEALEYHKSFSFPVELEYEIAAPDAVDISFSVTKVNGYDNTDANMTNQTSTIIYPEGIHISRNVVIEEFTGTWCGYCPDGITTMETIRKTYAGGEFIPVAVHCGDNNPMGGYFDPMVAASYQTIDNKYGGSYPGAIINRTDKCDPRSLQTVTMIYESYKDIPPTVGVSLAARPISGSYSQEVLLEASTLFAFDNPEAATNYTLQFAVTEDNVGPYYQTNYGSTGPSGSTIYNDVARLLVENIESCIPESAKSGCENIFRYRLALNNTVANLENVHFIAYLINRASGAIENAVSVKVSEAIDPEDVKEGLEEPEQPEIPDDPSAGITSATAADNAEAEYYTLQGVRVDNPEAGLYLRRQGNTVTKVIIR